MEKKKPTSFYHHLIDPGTSVSQGTAPSAGKTNFPFAFWTLSFKKIETYQINQNNELGNCKTQPLLTKHMTQLKI